MKRLAAVAALAVLAACSPKGAQIPPDPAHWDQIADKVKQLSPEDRR
jgi:predicted small lipoprotein YifL